MKNKKLIIAGVFTIVFIVGCVMTFIGVISFVKWIIGI